MKIKILIFLFLILLFSGLLAFNTYAYDSEMFESQLNASGAETLLESLSDDDIEMLDRLGIEELEFDAVFNVSLRQIADFIFELIRGEYNSVIDVLPFLFIIVTVSAAANIMLPDDGKINEIVDFICCLISSLIIISSLTSCLSNAASAIKTTSGFMLALIPVLAGIITVSGSPSLAFTYNSLGFVLSQFVSQLVDSFIRPLVQIVLSLSVVSSITDSADSGRVIEIIKKTVVFIFTFSATFFITFLSLKGMLAASADNVTVRGIRFLIGNAVPIIGGAVSDAYSSVIGTLNLVKNTVGVFAVIAVSVINLPVIIECFIWIFSLNLLSVYCSFFSQKRLSDLFKAVSSSLTILCVTVLFVLLVFVLSLGLVFVIKGSA